MKQSFLYLILIGFILFVGVLGAFLAVKGQQKDLEEVYYMGTSPANILEEENYVFTDYQDFKEKMNSDRLTKKDFEKHNYALIKVEYDSCSVKNMKLRDYSIQDSMITVDMDYEIQCGTCASEYMYYLIQIEKERKTVETKIQYHSMQSVDCGYF